MDIEVKDELKNLIGKHFLSGVDRVTVPHWFISDMMSQVFSFVLDGVTYSALEDPSDGCRSRMEKLLVSDAPVKNTFPPVEVYCTYLTSSDSYECDILRMYDAESGELVLEVGTANTDDYYPYFVAMWNPKDLSVNNGGVGMKEEEQVSFDLGLNPRISEVINALNEIKDNFGDVVCEMTYDGYPASIEFFMCDSGNLSLFMS